MSNENRVLTKDNIQDISNRLKVGKFKIKEEMTKVLEDTRKFSEDVVEAIGEISVTEAKQGIIDYFSDKIWKIK